MRLLREVVRTKLNLEMAATDEMVGIARDILPDMATLVPEKRQELTTEGGLDVAGNRDRIGHAVAGLEGKGHRREPLRGPGRGPGERRPSSVAADMIEIHTGRYSDAPNERAVREELAKIIAAARAGKAAGLGVNAGHGLHYRQRASHRADLRDRRAEHRAQHYREGGAGRPGQGSERHDRVWAAECFVRSE